MVKICIYCGSRKVVNHGYNNLKHRCLCNDCGHRFTINKVVDYQLLYQDYVFGKQTLKQLSSKYKISVSTVQRKLNNAHSTRIISSSKSVVVLMDTVYLGHNFGVVVMKYSRTRKILWRKFIRQK